MPRPRTRTDGLAAHVVDAALEIVRAEGLPALTTRRAASAGGTNIAALNQLFGSRDGLITAVALRGFELLVALLPDDVESYPPREAIFACAAAYRRFSAAEQALVDVMFARPLDGPVPRDHVVHRCRTILVDAFAAHAGLGAADAGERAVVEALALGFGALLEGLAIKERHGLLGRDPGERDAVWRRAVDAYVDGAAR